MSDHQTIFNIAATAQASGGLTAWNLLTATAALLAFLIGMLGLVGRDRKSPYLINRVILIFFLCLVGGAFDLLSLCVVWKGGGASLSQIISDALLYAGLITLVIAFIFSIIYVYNIFIRLHFFVDHITWKNLPIISDIRRSRKAANHKPEYEFNALKFPDLVDAGIKEIFKEKLAEIRGEDALRTLCVKATHVHEANDLLVTLSLLCLRSGVTVQYLTASRHPIGFVESLRARAEVDGQQWPNLAQKLVVIDAYSPHYAFLDSVYPKKTRELEALGVSVVKAKALYAGIHTAAGKAFNVLKKRSVDAGRAPTLVIYEDPYALVDLESPDQYRVFVRHVLPSERLWFGMFTVVVETAQPDGDWKVLQSYADVVIDLTRGAPKSAAEG